MDVFWNDPLWYIILIDWLKIQYLFCMLFFSAEVQEEFHPPPTPPDYRSVTKQDFFSRGTVFKKICSIFYKLS
jgi:hypothetical protein